VPRRDAGAFTEGNEGDGGAPFFAAFALFCNDISNLWKKTFQTLEKPPESFPMSGKQD
jgi:hypothetical protein